MTDPTTNKPFKKKLVITEQTELAHWQANGEDKTIYEVKAVNENGQPINKKLRSFHPEIPQGELIEFEVSEYIHEKWGQTFTLKLPSKGRASKKDITDLRSQFEGLANRLGAVEADIAQIKAKLLRDKPLDKPLDKPPPRQPTPRDLEADEKWGEDAPWP